MANERTTDGVNGAGDEPSPTDEAIAAAEAAIKDGLDETQRYLQRQLAELPLTVAATALGIGLLVGLLIGGRRE